MGDPHSPSIESKIESADQHTCNHQRDRGDVGIHEFIQVVEQKSTMVWFNSGFAFQPVLQQSQRTRPREQLGKDSPNKGTDMQPAENRARMSEQGTKDHP